jgi:hypothetical protein
MSVRTVAARLVHVVAAAALLVLGACTGTSGGAGKGVDTAVSEGVTFWPPEAARGQTFDATIASSTSIFNYTTDRLELGTGITVNSFAALDGWNAVANITVAEDAELGTYDATVTTDEGTFPIAEALRVVNDSFTITPDSAKIGESVTIEFIGDNTAWEAGKTWAHFGDDITVQTVDVLSETYLLVTATVEADAAPGKHDVSVDVGPEVTTLYGGFQVDRVGLTATFAPSTIAQGDSVEFTINGYNTHFDETSELTFYMKGDEKSDVLVTSMTPLGPEEFYGRMSASNAAELGWRDVLVTTGDEGVYIEDAFEVTETPVDLDDVGISLWFYVVRVIDNSTGEIYEYVYGGAVFWIPLDPPCPAEYETSCTDGVDNDDDEYVDCYDTDCGTDPACSWSPMPYDADTGGTSYEQGGGADCPTPVTVGAGEHVWFESACNVVTFDRTVDNASGRIYYTADLTLDDYCFDQVYDLHTQGEDGGIGEELVEAVQPTVPADFAMVDPEWWGNYTHARTDDLTYTWTPAETYPDAIFVTSISSTKADGSEPWSISHFPWDDGEATYPSSRLLNLIDGPATFSAYSYIRGDTFGFDWSTIQTNQSDSYVYVQGSLILE